MRVGSVGQSRPEQGRRVETCWQVRHPDSFLLFITMNQGHLVGDTFRWFVLWNERFRLEQMQSFAARLALLTELKAAPMPSWWKPAVHDAHLLIASCIYGESGSLSYDDVQQRSKCGVGHRAYWVASAVCDRRFPGGLAWRSHESLHLWRELSCGMLWHSTEPVSCPDLAVSIQFSSKHLLPETKNKNILQVIGSYTCCPASSNSGRYIPHAVKCLERFLAFL